MAPGGIVNDQDIKRKLSIGLSTLSEHLRDYKDPFEPSDACSLRLPRKSALLSSCNMSNGKPRPVEKLPDL
ncbi:MAG TPA: hypothetical protein DEQ40_06505 [Oxalobacteraceae bacterium]|nr:hypothetical protein [Oxalobacteraceae bacterium]